MSGQRPRTIPTLLALAATLALAARVQGGGTAHQTPPPAALDAILADTVRGEGVDYARIRERHLPALERYLDRSATVEPERLPPAERLAFYINLYNATVLDAVARRLTPGFSASRDEFRLFDEPLVRLAGGAISLNELEHGIVRRRFAEPRVHAALVCAARSCPPLLPRAYRALDLEATLDANMRRFVNDPRRNVIDAASRSLRLSRIFEWYAEDFGGREALAAYVDRYTEQDVSGFDVTFLDYSWELNSPSGSE